MESNNSKQRPMKQYLEWLEKQIDFCLEDKTMQREHWAFCRAYEKFKSLETTDESEELTPYIEYYSNGNVWIKGQMNSRGQNEGYWERFHNNGNISMITPYKAGKIDGIEEFFYTNGNIQWRIRYKKDKKDGIQEQFYPNGNIKLRTPYKEGKKDGTETYHDEQVNITKTTLWKNGEVIEETKPELTPHIEYHPNGNVEVKGQKNSKGQQEGIWEFFYENGNIQWRIPYKEGEIDGIREWFYENGNISWRTPYKEGNEDGIEELFDKQGNIIRTRVWKNGEVIVETKNEQKNH